MLTGQLLPQPGANPFLATKPKENYQQEWVQAQQVGPVGGSTLTLLLPMAPLSSDGSAGTGVS